MKYLGSKARIWKHIGPIILESRREGQCYVEPFVGGANSLSQVTGWRLAADLNPYLIGMWNSLLNDEPQFYPIPESLYRLAAKSYKDRDGLFSDADLGWIGFNASYNGKFFDGYAGNYPSRDYITEAIRNILRQIPFLQGVTFVCCDYRDLYIPPRSLLYLDPPYRQTTRYRTGNFDNDAFWEWVREKKNEGHTVFVSEYSAPDDFREVWSGKVANPMNRFKVETRTEKLFTL